MIDLLKQSFLVYNLPFTILVLIVLVYWVIAMCGMIDLDGLDLDLDPDLEGDGVNGGVMNGLLKMTGASDVPLVMLLSVLSVFLWLTNLLANHYFNPENNLTRALLLFIPVLLISIIITRLLIKPLAPLMQSIQGEEPAAQIIGEEGKVISATINKEFGRIEVDFDGRPILLNATLTGSAKELKKGETVLVISKDEKADTYKVRQLSEGALNNNN